MKKLLGIVCGFVLLVVACSKGDNNSSNNNNNGGNNNPGTVDCNSVSATFAANVAPLIQNSCAKSGCHATGSANGPGALTNYTQISNNKTAIRSAVSTGAMPKDATLTATQKATITCWVDGGALNN